MTNNEKKEEKEKVQQQFEMAKSSDSSYQWYEVHLRSRRKQFFLKGCRVFCSIIKSYRTIHKYL